MRETLNVDLLDFVSSYTLERSLSELYAENLRRTATQLAEHCGGKLDLTQLNADGVNRWLVALEKNNRNPVTVANKRRHIKTLWTAAHEQNLAPPVGRLRKVKVPRRIPQALTIEQLQLLVKTADLLRGNFKMTKTCRRLYWRSLLLAGWDTALRISDLRSIERNWIWEGGFVSIVQHKTGYSHRVQLRPETIAAIDSLLAGRKTGLIWDTLNKKNFYDNLRKLALTAGVPWNFRMIRRASASYVERDHPGHGWRHLGHSRPGIAETFYLDPKIVAPSATQPPSLKQPPKVD